ncbi:hypothetical protein CXG81DRAFT_24876 [Caulochytrium protostelioides]|uniref:PLOD1-3-like GT domain-containing protein n=1 Tax=Caulochytrium protostelioides TaxID=1555241 RepID=A0A4P9XAU5_9FUNG|nr:hypothetical protein CXG81DRAFT_24876 [Caulochytrium protostelioides]|eukprot:RKP02503.1 hypothetical protein CXG81DRAFT_24876 [Caulochytrium protostelioides]
MMTASLLPRWIGGPLGLDDRLRDPGHGGAAYTSLEKPATNGRGGPKRNCVVGLLVVLFNIVRFLLRHPIKVLLPLALFLLYLVNDTIQRARNNQTYMSCWAPRLGSYHTLLLINSAPCAPETRVSDDVPVWVPPSCQTDPGQDACHLQWVTFSTRCTAQLNTLARSVHAAGISFKTIGYKHSWPGWGGRVRMLGEHLATMPDDDIVIFSDADDVLLIPGWNATRFINRFKALASPVVFMAEKVCWPLNHLESVYPRPSSETPYRYLNGGGYIGYVWALRALIQRGYEVDCMDDQKMFTELLVVRDVSYVITADGKRVITERGEPAYEGAVAWEGNQDHPSFDDTWLRHPMPSNRDAGAASTPPSTDLAVKMPNRLQMMEAAAGHAPPNTRVTLIRLDYYTHILASLWNSYITEWDVVVPPPVPPRAVGRSAAAETLPTRHERRAAPSSDVADLAADVAAAGMATNATVAEPRVRSLAEEDVGVIGVRHRSTGHWPAILHQNGDKSESTFSLLLPVFQERFGIM